MRKTTVAIANVRSTEPDDRERVREPQHLLLVPLPEPDPVVGGGHRERAGRRHRQQDRGEVHDPVGRGRLLEPARERNGQEEGEEDLHARQDHAETVQQLDQLAVDALLR